MASKSSTQTVAVNVNPSGLAQGQYSGMITIGASSTNPTSQQVPVTLTVDAAPPQNLAPVLSVSPSSLTFSFVQGGSLDVKQLSVSNAGGGSLAFAAAASSQGNWLSAASGNFSAAAGSPQPISITANPAGLQAGTYTGQVTVTNTGNGQNQVIPVTAVVTANQQSILLSQTAVALAAAANGTDPVPATFAVINTGLGNMNFTVEATPTVSGATWLSVTPASGSSAQGTPSAAIQIKASAAGLAPGEYFGTVLVKSDNAGNSPQVVTVRFSVLDASAVLAPVVQPSGVILSANAGSATGTAQQIQVYNLSARPIGYSSVRFTEEGIDWFSQSPVKANLDRTGVITITPNFSKLTAGVHRGTLSVLFGDGSVRNIDVVAVANVPGSSAAASAPVSEARRDDTAGAEQREAASTRDPRPSAAPCTLGMSFRSPGNGDRIEAGKPYNLEMTVMGCNNPLNNNPQVTVQFSVRGSFAGSITQKQFIPKGSGVFQTQWVPDPALYGADTAVVLTGTIIADNDSGKTTTNVTVYPPTNKAVPRLTAGGVVNSGSYLGSDQVAPGHWISIFGSNLADGPLPAQSTPLGTNLGKAQVSIGRRMVPLSYVSDTQINAQVPYDLPSNLHTQLTITHGTDQTDAEDLTIADIAPAIFTTNNSGTGQAAIVKSGGIVSDKTNPAKRGDTIVIYCTGLGVVDQNIDLGAVTPAPAPQLIPQNANNLNVTIGGVDAKVTFSGLSPGSVALYQVNAIIPQEVTPGDNVPVVIGLQGKTSQQTATIAVQ